MSQTAEKTQDRNQRVVAIGRADLPLSCPRPGDDVWNMHPRVYLPLDDSGEAICPYCGTRYVLNDPD